MRVASIVGTLLVLALPLGAQQQTDFEQLLNRYFANADEYEKTFRNLVAEETKTIEIYRDSGEIEKRREIVSDLLVYHSTRHNETTEYRDVRSVDGKAIEKRGERALKLLTTASKADSIEKELKAIRRETSKYEFSKHIQGGTIHQGGALRARRDLFQVEWAGREQIAGHEVVVLNYRQRALVPGFDQRFRLPDEFGKPLILSQGRLWLDAETHQLWRSVWELAVPHPALPDPLVIIRGDTRYAPSRFDILVPERIVFDWVMRFSHPKNGPPAFGLSERTTFTYGSFRKFEVATDEQVHAPVERH
jgi:hypothetical protein